MVYSVVVSQFSYKWITRNLMNNPDTLEGNVVNLANNSKQGVRHAVRSCQSKHSTLRNEDEDLEVVNKIVYLHIPTTSGLFKGPQTESPVEITVSDNVEQYSPPPIEADNSHNTSNDEENLDSKKESIIKTVEGENKTFEGENKTIEGENKTGSSEDKTEENFDFFIHVLLNISSLEGIYNFLSALHLVYTVIPIVDLKTRLLYEKMFRKAELVIEVIETGDVSEEFKDLPMNVHTIEKMQHLSDEHCGRKQIFNFSVLNGNFKSEKRLQKAMQKEIQGLSIKKELDLDSHYKAANRYRMETTSDFRKTKLRERNQIDD